MEELFSYYSLDECGDRKSILKRLKELEKEGKIEFDLDKSTDIFKLVDIDLEEDEIEDLINLFDEYDVFPYLDKDGEEDDDYRDFGDDEDYDY